MIVAPYLRVSTERQDEKNQEPEVLRLIAARGWSIYETYRETESGAKERPVWTRILAAAKRGEIRAVVVWSLDRCGRSMFQLLADVRELNRLGVQLVSVREPWCDTGGPVRELLLAIFAEAFGMIAVKKGLKN